MTCIARLPVEEGSVRIATGCRDRSILVWHLDALNRLKSVFSIQLNNTVPKGLSFVDGAARDLQIFGLFDGLM